MTVFQTLTLLVFATLAVLTVSAGLRGQVRKRIVVFWLLVWLGGATAVAWPQATVILARALGIGRGADLLLYVSVVGTLVGFFYIYARFRRLDRQMTLLVRRLALLRPELPEPASAPRDTSGSGSPPA